MLTLRNSVLSVGTGTVHLLCGEGTPDGSPAPPRCARPGRDRRCWGGAGARTDEAVGQRNLRSWSVTGCAASTAVQWPTPGTISTVALPWAAASSELASGGPTLSSAPVTSSSGRFGSIGPGSVALASASQLRA